MSQHPKLNAGGLLSAGGAATSINAGNVRAPVLPYAPEQLIHFYGYLHGLETHHFQCLAGEQPPTHTGGFANVTNVTRPRSVDYTMVTDYPAITMDVPIRFDNWVNWGKTVNPNVEEDISRLMWMAGLGKLGPGKPQSGDPPIVKVAAFGATGKNGQVPLIPPDLQDLEWIISSITWDTAPIRFDAAMLNARNLTLPIGTRARQDAVVSLVRWTPEPGFKTRKRKPKAGVRTAYSSAKNWNVRLMCENVFDRSKQSDFKAVMTLSANKHLKLRSPGQRIKNGTKVAFPQSFHTDDSN